MHSRRFLFGLLPLCSISFVAVGLLSLSLANPVPAPQASPTPSGIPAVECTNQPVICCQEVAPLQGLSGLLVPILNALGLPVPSLDTIVAIECETTILGLGCAASPLCCGLVIASSGDVVGVDCQPVTSSGISGL